MIDRDQDQHEANRGDAADAADRPVTADDPEAFRPMVRSYLKQAKATGVACPAFGAIVPPAMFDRALAWQRHLAETGFAGIHWPVEYGGRGLSRAHGAVWYEECATARVAPYLNLQGLVLAGEAIIRSGTDAQKARFLAPTLSGEVVWCQLFSEPDAGSDLASLATAAVRDGDHYVLNGQKVWCSNGQFANFGILLARTEPTVPKHRGISFFLLDMTLPGVDVRPLRQMTGDQEFCEVFFDDVPVPADAVLGPEHDGWRVAMEVLGDERGAFGSAGIISLQQKLDRVAAMAAGTDAVATAELTTLLTRGHALRALLQRTGTDVTMGPAAKLLRSEVDISVNQLAASISGPSAMIWGEDTERFLYAPGMRLAGGTTEIQRNIIGERLLGLPREPTPGAGSG